MLYADGRSVELRSPRRVTDHTHGSGDTLASAITAGLARGLDLEAAVRTGKAFVTGAVADSFPLGPRARAGRALLAGARLAGGRRPLPRLSPSLPESLARSAGGAETGGESSRSRAGVICLGDRPHDDRAARAVGDHLVQPVERLDAADREPGPLVSGRGGACDNSDNPAADRPGLVGVVQVGPQQ